MQDDNHIGMNKNFNLKQLTQNFQTNNVHLTKKSRTQNTI